MLLVSQGKRKYRNSDIGLEKIGFFQKMAYCRFSLPISPCYEKGSENVQVARAPYVKQSHVFKIIEEGNIITLKIDDRLTERR